MSIFGKTPPTSQKASRRPISFVLTDDGDVLRGVTLVIRPEDLTRTQTSRTAVHQTLGRGLQGWVDEFGEGLPSCTISGHTGWRYTSNGGDQQDGSEAFRELNSLVMEEYHEAKQKAIDEGRDPAQIKLIFSDDLDFFAWSVVPTQFQLRRSKSRPLLYQYQISLQAVDTNVDAQHVDLPERGSVPSGQSALAAVDSKIQGQLVGLPVALDGYVRKSQPGLLDELAGFGNNIAGFVTKSLELFARVQSEINTGAQFFSDQVNFLIQNAQAYADVGRNVFRTIGALEGLAEGERVRIMAMASSYNEAFCVFGNSLRPRGVFEDFSSLYGASNCSSTTGGRPASAYASTNPFELMFSSTRQLLTVGTDAKAAIERVNTSDVVLAPLSLTDINTATQVMVAGTKLK